MHKLLSFIALALVTVLFASACGRTAASLDQREERHPLVQRGIAKKRAHDFDGAVELFQKAIDKDSSMARPHLELGIIFDDYKEDYLRAIYHYERYLELRPDSEKAGIIRELIRHARISFAASLPDTPDGSLQEISRLRKEISHLRERLARAEGGSAAPAAPVAAPAGKRTGSIMEPEPAPASPAIERYTVLTGDTLSKIARKVYGDAGRWKVIYEANKDTLNKPEAVKVGQTLMIPR
ncbi:MAG: LysM peptidoglycan-binding domain-containing protein [Verrucomicrobia bacterium]|nr:LysM peptidoglycan-binding domain-containing protein [Verrucomicrobiota bacterium]